MKKRMYLICIVIVLTLVTGCIRQDNGIATTQNGDTIRRIMVCGSYPTAELWMECYRVYLGSGRPKRAHYRLGMAIWNVKSRGVSNIEGYHLL